MMTPDQLCTTQRQPLDQLMAALPAGNIFEVRCKPGRGRTTVLSALRGAFGGAMLTVKDFDDVIRSLEDNIVIPLENGDLARELELQFAADDRD